MTEHQANALKAIRDAMFYRAYAPIGTTIERTLQARDLIPAFCDELETAMQRYRWQGMTDESKAFSEYRELIKESRAIDCDTLEAGYCLESLFNALGDFAPPYTYFGAHPGDGSDFGFWPHADAESLADAHSGKPIDSAYGESA